MAETLLPQPRAQGWPSAASRWRWPLVGAGVFLFGYLLLVWLSGVPKGHVASDSIHLVQGARQAAACIDAGTWSACGHLPGTDQTLVGPYPLLQYIPAFAAVKAGLSNAQVLGVLSRLSALAFVGCLTLSWFALRRRPALAAVAVIALVASAATYQATSPFGEMLAAFVALGAVVAALERRPVLVLLAFFAASLGKETMPLFLLPLGLVAARDDADGWLPPRRLLAPMLGGLAAGTLLSAAFNVFRFGTVRNLLYLSPDYRVPGLGWKLDYLAGQWVAPTSGLAWYWPVGTAVIVMVAAVGLRRLLRHRRNWRSWAPPLVTVGTFFALTLGLAAWYSPFGWVAYGHRLVVPLLPATIVLGLRSAQNEVVELLGAIRRQPLVFASLLAIVGLAAWSQVAAPWRYREVLALQTRPDTVCTPNRVRTVQSNLRCTSHTMWRLDPLPLQATMGGGDAVTILARLSAITVVGLLVVVAVGSAAARPRETEDDEATPNTTRLGAVQLVAPPA